MSPGVHRVDRNFLYTSGKLTSSGIALPGTPEYYRTPGPGYYEGPLIATVSSIYDTFSYYLIYLLTEFSRSTEVDGKKWNHGICPENDTEYLEGWTSHPPRW